MKIAALFLATATVAGAQPTNNAVVGIGARTCGEWTSARAAGEKSSLFVSMGLSWAQGHLSGMNEDGSARRNGLDLPEVPTVLAYLDKHCADHPLHFMWMATVEMRSALRQMQGK